MYENTRRVLKDQFFLIPKNYLKYLEYIFFLNKRGLENTNPFSVFKICIKELLKICSRKSDDEI